MQFYADQEAEFRIFNKEKMQWEVDHVYTAPPMVNVHHINAFEAGNSIVFDTMLASNGDTVSLFEYTNLNSTGQHLKDSFNLVAPVGTAHRFVLDLGKFINYLTLSNHMSYRVTGQGARSTHELFE